MGSEAILPFLSRDFSDQVAAETLFEDVTRADQRRKVTYGRVRSKRRNFILIFG